MSSSAWFGDLLRGCGGCLEGARRDAQIRDAEQSFLIRNPSGNARRGLQAIDVAIPSIIHDIPSERSTSPVGSRGHSSASPSAAGSSDLSRSRGILRGVSFKDVDTRSVGAASQGSGSSPASIEGLRSEHSGALARTKDINARILDAQRQNERLEPQIEHYLTIANRPRIDFVEKTRAMDKVKQLRSQQAARSRTIEELKATRDKAEGVANQAKSIMRQNSVSKFTQSASFRASPDRASPLRPTA